MVQADVWLQNQTLVPTANFGLLATEPADAIFNATTLPGASAADITQAKNLYAMLTGRITQLAGDARINEAGDTYVPLGLSRAAGRMREFNFFVADSWHATNRLTISGGLRYVLALPFYPTNNSYTNVTEAQLYGISGDGNIFKPGTITGSKAVFNQYRRARTPTTRTVTTSRPALVPHGRRPAPTTASAGSSSAPKKATASCAAARRWRFSVPACRTSPAPSVATRAFR